LDRTVGQIHVDRIRSVIHSHPHGFVLSKYAVTT
jgi:hypothetical protein